jgi:hypothetical protein
MDFPGLVQPVEMQVTRTANQISRTLAIVREVSYSNVWE